LSQKVLHSPHLPYKLVCYYLDPLSACAGNGDRPEKFDRWLLGRSLGSMHYIMACTYTCILTYYVRRSSKILPLFGNISFSINLNLYSNGGSTVELYCII
jgi:hypothetical protein